METYCGVCKFDLSLLYCVLLLICCFVMIGVNGHIPGWKEGEHMAIFGIDVAHVGVKPNPHIIIFATQRLQWLYHYCRLKYDVEIAQKFRPWHSVGLLRDVSICANWEGSGYV